MKKQQIRGRCGAPAVFLSCLCATFVGTACGKKADPAATVGSASASARASASAPPRAPAYAGPVATVRGRVVLEGDEPPDLPIPGTPPARCGKVKEVYGKLFRVGADKGLGDAIVGVTEYQGVPAEPTDVVIVQIGDCVFQRRTYTLSKLQDLEVHNRDPESYLPHLNGARATALNVAVPGQKPLLHHRGPGRYLLTDDLNHPWMQADVFVFAYRTHAVTDTHGAFEIRDIPVGKSKLSVVHPQIGRTVVRELDLKDGETVELTLAMPFDKKTDYHPNAAALASASASAPAASTSAKSKAPKMPH